MNDENFEYFSKKHSRWTDDIKRDIKFIGIGTVNNLFKFGNGQRREKPSQDRWFSYELKENEIFAYAVLDGFNGTWAVDLLEQYLLSNLYFDHLQTLSSRTDEEIFEILTNEFIDAERYLLKQSEEIIMKRRSISLHMAGLSKRSAEYHDYKLEIDNLDLQLRIGAFAVISLIVNDRLFVANLGTSHCFVCVYDKNSREKKVINLETEHNLKNWNETQRLLKNNSNLNGSTDEFPIKYTRCFGNFNLKHNFYEIPQFENCEKCPIISQPQHPSTSYTIDDSFLFMVIYSDGVVKALEKTDGKDCNPSAILALKIISKLISEPTLNNAAQSVLDEIKRSYDDKTMLDQINEREDFTLIIRSFDANLKNVLDSLEKSTKMPDRHTEVNFTEVDFENESDDDENNDSISNTIRTTNLSDSINSIVQSNSSQDDVLRKRLDEKKENAIPYLDFENFNLLIKEDEPIDKFCLELEKLA